MKRFIAATVLAAAAVVPATQAGAVPPDNTGVPAGSTHACAVVATPAPVPASCNFTGASGGVGYGGVSTGGFTLTHQEKVNVCTDDGTGTRRVSSYTLNTRRDEGSSASGAWDNGPSYSFATGIVYTLTVKGVGFGAVGGQGTPGPDMASEPKVGGAPGYAGAQGGSPLGAACPTPAAAAATSISEPPSHGLEGMAQLDRLPVLDPTVHVAGASSHGRDGSNSDSSPYLEQDAKGRYVLMEAEGPGAIVRIWFTGPATSAPMGNPAPAGNIQFLFDGEEKPRIDMPVAEFLSGKSAALGTPLCGDYTVSSGGNYCSVRMPFAKSVRVVTTASPAFYNFGYETYPAGTVVESFDPATDATVQAVKAAGAVFARAGSDPAILPDGESHSGIAGVAASSSAPLLYLGHGGTIRAIRVALDHYDDATLQSVWLQVRWDDQALPAVSAPLADLFSSGAGERTPAKGLFAGYLPDRHEGYLYYPMPFASGAEVTLVNRSAAAVKATWAVEESPAVYAGIGRTTGYFHATYNVDQATTSGVDYTLLDAGGAGKVLGLSYTEQGQFQSSLPTFMEGDERVHFDGSRSPAIYGTGTEDLFGGAYYYTKLFTLPDHGATAKEDTTPGMAQTAQYRLFVNDPWSFRDGIHFGIEHAGGDGQQTSNHSVVYWYGTGHRQMRQTDAFEVTGDTPLTAFFEGDHDGNVATPGEVTVTKGSNPPPAGTDPQGEAVTASGLSHPAGATIAFTARLDPANNGAILRRLMDQGTFGQRAEVSIDGEPAGIWFTPGNNASKRWVESDFALAAALTAGKQQINVQLRVLPAVDPSSGVATGWTDFRYTTFSVIA